MQRNTRWIISGIATIASLFVGSMAGAEDAPPSGAAAVNNIVEFQCHGAKTLQQAEKNYAQMGRQYTDVHPVMACLKKKIEEMKAGRIASTG